MLGGVQVTGQFGDLALEFGDPRARIGRLGPGGDGAWGMVERVVRGSWVMVAFRSGLYEYTVFYLRLIIAFSGSASPIIVSMKRQECRRPQDGSPTSLWVRKCVRATLAFGS